jgi:Tfp pilus assembly PilM family ATPase/Tfp pilus assembly protein PilN
VSVPVPPALREAGPTAIGDWLTTTLRRHGFHASQAVWSIPRHRIILRWLLLPSGTPEEIAQMVRFQAGKDLPLPVEQVRYNYVRIGTEPSAAPGAAGKVRLLFAAVPSAVADRSVAIADAAGLTLAGALPSMLATWTLARTTRPDLFPRDPGTTAAGATPAAPDTGTAPADATTDVPAPEDSGPPVAVIDIGWGSSEVAVGGVHVRYSRSAPVGLSGLAVALAPPAAPAGTGAAPPAADSKAAAEAPAAADPLAAVRDAASLPPAAADRAERHIAEIARSLRAMQAELGGAEPGCVLVAGGGAGIPAVRTLLARELGLPVWALEPAGGAVAAAAEAAEAAHDPGFAAAAGAALSVLREDAPFLNLLGALQVRRHFLHMLLKVGGIAAAAVLAVVLVAGWILLSRKDADLEQRKDRLKGLKPRVDQIVQIEKKAQLAAQWSRDDRVLVTDLLREITALLPPEAYVTTLTIDEAGTIRFNGRTKSNQVMSKLVTSLNGSKAFVNATMGAFTKNNDKGDFKYDYSITVQVRGLAPEKPNGDKGKPKLSLAR